jgi:4-amino-4-deoxy-L-arabinose transferase-like glycosyltransferase
MHFRPVDSQFKIDRLIIAILILAACTAAVYFRFYNLRQTPGWYSDEGNPIDLAENWNQGKWKNYGVLGAPYSQRPPMFMYVTAAAMRVFGVDIGVTRGVGTAASLICVLLVCWIAWKTLGVKEGIMTLWVAGVAPWIVIFGRFGLTYNLMAPFFIFSLITIYYYCQKPTMGWLIAAGVSAALASTTDYLGILCGVTVGLALLVKRPRAIGWFILAFLITIVAVLLPVILTNSQLFLSDTFRTFFDRGGVQSTPFSLISVLINYTELLRRESWILIGLCGLFLIKDGLLRNILLTSVGLTLLMVTRAYVPVGGGLHYLMHLFPIFGLGLAIFLLNAYDFLKGLLHREFSRLFAHIPRLTSPVSVFLTSIVVFTPLVWMFLSSFAMITYNVDYIFTGNDDLGLVNVQHADQVRTFVSDNVNPGDLVLGSPALIWGLPTMNRADFMTALAWEGHKPKNFIEVTDDRFTHDVSLQKAKFVILDPLAEEFAVLVLPGMDAWLLEIHQWPVVFEAGDIKVYKK